MTDEIKAVVFDFGGVVLTSNDKEEYNNKMGEIAAKIGLPTGPDVKKRVYTNGSEWPEAKVGKMSGEEMFTKIFGEFGVTDAATVKEFSHIVRCVGRGVNPKLLALIDDLKKRGLRIGLLSNYDTDLRDMLVHHKVENVFDPMLNSAELGVAKPDHGSYEKMLESLGMTKEQGHQVIFIDDKPRNTVSAQEFGIPHCVVYTSIDQCVEDVLKIVNEKNSASA